MLRTFTTACRLQIIISTAVALEICVEYCSFIGRFYILFMLKSIHATVAGEVLDLYLTVSEVVILFIYLFIFNNMQGKELEEQTRAV